MKILGIGVDIVENSRIKRLLKNNIFINRIFSKSEILQAKIINNRVSYYSKRFAAKEAVYKALSRTGVSGLGWQQAETLSLPNGTPVMTLTGQCKMALEALTPDGYKAQISISLSDEPPYALAFVIINAVPLKLDN